MCGAKCQAGHACPNPAMPNGRCRIHRGNADYGMANAAYKHGRYSKHLPTRLAVQYETARTDPELTSVREEAAVVQTRFQELLTKIQASDLGTLWPALRKAHEAFLAARQAQDVEGMQTALATMSQHIERGAEDWHLWQAINDQATRLAALRMQEHKRTIDLKLVMTQEQSNLLLGMIVSVITETLTRHLGQAQARSVYADIARQLDKHLDSHAPALVATGPLVP